MDGVMIKRLEPVHEDERGGIWDLLNEEIGHVGFLTSKKGSIRGNHYFKTSKRYAYVWSGKYEVALAHADTPVKVEKVILQQGDLIEIPPKVIHTFKAIEDSILFGMDSKSRAGTGYEDEMTRVDIIKAIPVCVPWLPGNEKKYAFDAIESNLISGAGRYIDEFERKFSDYIGVKHGVSCTNGTAALHLACMTLNLKRGDEIIVPTFTNIASVNSVILTGARPVLVDSEPETWNIDVKKIEGKITERTRAIMVVHIYGHPCDMDPVLELASRRNLRVIEDVAEAHGAEYKGRKCGSIGDIGCFSFYSNKVLTTGEGGMCVTNNERFAHKMKSLRNLAFGVPRFLHHEVGFNYRMSNIHAAIGLAQTENATKLVEARRNIGLKYNAMLAGIPGLVLPVEKRYAKNVYWMYGIVLSEEVLFTRDEVMKMLKERGVDSRSFFIPMNRQPAFVEKKVENAPDCSGAFPVADKIGERGFYIPSSSNLSDEEIVIVANALRDIISRNKNV